MSDGAFGAVFRRPVEIPSASPERRGVDNDGTVTVASELPIQRQAVHIMGFDEPHTGILESPQVAEQLNAILARASATKP